MTRTMNPVHETATCAVAACAEIIGAKWTALLVHDLSEGPRRFSQLERSCSGISPRTLAEHLLERAQPELHRGGVRLDEPGRGAGPLDVDVGALGSGVPDEALGGRADRRHVLAGRQADRELAGGLHGERRVPQARLAADDA